jgi:hypothetical protein
MQYIQFILEGNSNKQLDALSKELVSAIRKVGGIKAGPIPFKGKRMIYVYSNDTKTITALLGIDAKKYKKVSKIAVNILERPQ